MQIRHNFRMIAFSPVKNRPYVKINCNDQFQPLKFGILLRETEVLAAGSVMQEVRHMVILKGIVLLVCTGMVVGNSITTFDQPTPSQTLSATSTINQTATLNSLVVSMATQSTSTMITPSRSSSSRVISSSSVFADRTTESQPNNKDEEEKEKEKKETALIVASCAGGATLVIGLFVVTCTHRRGQKP